MRVHHIGYAVGDLDQATRLFVDLGYCREGPVVCDEDRRVMIQFVRNGSYLVELLAALGDGSPVKGVLQRSGSGPYHICYACSDLGKATAMLIGQGYRKIEEPGQAVALGNARVAFFYHRQVGLLELLELNEQDRCGCLGDG